MVRLNSHHKIDTCQAERRKSVREVAGVDISKKSVAHARRNYPNGKFEALDGWDSTGLLRLADEWQGTSAGNGGWDVIYVDISGLSGRGALLDALALIGQLRRGCGGSLRAIVAKSRCLRDFANTFVDARTLN